MNKLLTTLLASLALNGVAQAQALDVTNWLKMEAEANAPAEMVWIEHENVPLKLDTSDLIDIEKELHALDPNGDFVKKPVTNLRVMYEEDMAGVVLGEAVILSSLPNAKHGVTVSPLPIMTAREMSEVFAQNDADCAIGTLRQYRFLEKAGVNLVPVLPVYEHKQRLGSTAYVGLFCTPSAAQKSMFLSSLFADTLDRVRTLKSKKAWIRALDDAEQTADLSFYEQDGDKGAASKKAFLADVRNYVFSTKHEVFGK